MQTSWQRSASSSGSLLVRVGPHETISGPSAILFPFSLSTSSWRRRRRLEHTGSKRSEVLLQLGTRGACLSRSLQSFAPSLSRLESVAPGPRGCGPSRAAAESAAVPAAAGLRDRRVLISQLSCHHRLSAGAHPPPNSHIGPFIWLTRTCSFPGIGGKGRVKGDFIACSLQPWANYFLCNSPWCGFLPSTYAFRL